jgi:hypothetical protein
MPFLYAWSRENVDDVKKNVLCGVPQFLGVVP